MSEDRFKNLSEEEKKQVESAAETYIKSKKELDALKKVVDAANARCKDLMQKFHLQMIPCEDKVLNYHSEERVSLDEEKLIKAIHKHAPESRAIKMKEYVDMDILEGEMYRGEIPQEAMQAFEDCEKSTTVIKLTIAKNREE